MTASHPKPHASVTRNGHTPRHAALERSELRRFSGHAISLPVFEGPLDLLLHLVKQNRYDIFDIPIAAITEQYLRCVRLLELLDFEVAGEFMLMAAELLTIKSKLLLPPEEEASAEDEVALDPRLALAERLLEYQRFREAAETLRDYHDLRSRMFHRPLVLNGSVHRPPDQANDGSRDQPKVLLMQSVSLFDLLYAFQRVLDRTREEPAALVRRDLVTLPERIRQLGARIRLAARGLSFEQLCDDCELRIQVIVTFLAVLELIRRQRIVVEQDEAFGEMRIVARGRAWETESRESAVPRARVVA